MMMKTEEELRRLPWTMLYEPKTLDDMCLAEGLKAIVKNAIMSSRVFQFSLIGKPGIGKTTICNIIVNSCDCDYLIHPCSIDGSIDTVKTKILSFCEMLSSKPRKIVVLDEADQLSQAAQLSLRNIIVNHQDDCCFILTANEVSRIHSALLSRCPSYDIKFDPSEVVARCYKILTAENISFTKKEFLKFKEGAIKELLPDVRRIVESLQLMSSSGTLVYYDRKGNSEDCSAVLREYISRLLGPFSELRKWWISNDSEFGKDYPELGHKIFNFFDDNSEAMLLIADSLWRMSFELDREIQFSSMTLNLQNLLKSQKVTQVVLDRKLAEMADLKKDEYTVEEDK